jgi:uncharacterized protein YprB with RNaseH-like and TPR domain
MIDRDTISRLRSMIAEMQAAGPRTCPRQPADYSEGMASLGFVRRTNSMGAYFVRREEYPSFHAYGLRSLRDCFATPWTYRMLAQDDAHGSFDPCTAVFLDTETTGLAGGTGTHVFLVGLGEFTQDSFILTQYIMPDPSDEVSMLGELEPFFKSHRWLVSFNGKAFDVPLLETRYVVNRLRSPFSDAPHFDLLHAARRIWRGAYDCSLQSLEARVLGCEREGDIPGALIPSVFFEYLRRRDASLLTPVIEHNRNDVLALAALLGQMCRRVQEPHKEGRTAVELLNIGRLFERTGMYGESAQCYCEAPHYGSGQDVKLLALQKLASVRKRQRDYAGAASAWIEVVGQNPLEVRGFVELAKHAEHREKDFARAAEMCQKAISALSVLLSASPTPRNRSLLQDLKKRLDRIERKTAARTAQSSLTSRIARPAAE